MRYSEANQYGTMGVEIVLSDNVNESVVRVKRTRDRVMIVKLCIDENW